MSDNTIVIFIQPGPPPLDGETYLLFDEEGTFIENVTSDEFCQEGWWLDGDRYTNPFVERHEVYYHLSRQTLDTIIPYLLKGTVVEFAIRSAE